VARLSPEAQRSLQALRRGLIHDLPALLKNEMIGAVDEEAAALVDLMKSVAPVDQDVNNGAPPVTHAGSVVSAPAVPPRVPLLPLAVESTTV
jgi:hypothetical protein